MLIIERLEWNLRASELDVVEFLVIRTLICSNKFKFMI